jgi:hypothetical protein
MNIHIPNFTKFINETEETNLVSVSFATDDNKLPAAAATDAAEAYALEINISKEKITITGEQSDIDDFLKDYDITPNSK